jgi:two-component system chemotaxis sensor kinase CheA
MKTRMQPVKKVFGRFPRVVRDLARNLKKEVDLVLNGEDTDLDKNLVEALADPLVHLVRNALDHGVEMPEERLAAGKPETGVMKLSASHEAGNIVICIADDGAGINPEKVLAKAKERGIVGENESLSIDEINHLIFRPGFSTAEVVSDVSGRGVGMDVVRRNIQDLGGRVEIESEHGRGSTFTIRLPLTMAILDGQLVRAGNHIYIVPLLNIIESVVIDENKISDIGMDAQIYRLREQNIPIIHTESVLSRNEGYDDSLEHCSNDITRKILVVVDLGTEMVGLVIDELLDQQQVVIKSLESNFRQIDGLSGATILGDGAVALILDLSGLVNQCYRNKSASNATKKKLKAEVA